MKLRNLSRFGWSCWECGQIWIERLPGVWLMSIEGTPDCVHPGSLHATELR